MSGYAKPHDKRRCAEAGFDLHISKPAEAEVFHGLIDLLRLSSEIAWTSRHVARPSPSARADVMIRQLEMANLALDTAALAVSREVASRCIAKAEEARDRVTIWLNRGACSKGRVGSMVKALSALRQRAFSCQQQLLRQSTRDVMHPRAYRRGLDARRKAAVNMTGWMATQNAARSEGGRPNGPKGPTRPRPRERDRVGLILFRTTTQRAVPVPRTLMVDGQLVTTDTTSAARDGWICFQSSAQ